MRAAGIVLMCVSAAVVYGVVHDQVTARVCVEYFTVAHPPVFPTDDPTLLGLGWGIIATWWVGLLLGLGLAVAARAGSRPPRSVRSLVRPVLTLLAVTGVAAAVTGVVGYVLAEAGVIWVLKPEVGHIPPERHSRFLADVWAHTASYAFGLGGGLIVIARVWQSRQADR